MLTKEILSSYETLLTQPSTRVPSTLESEILLHKGILLELFEDGSAKSIALLIQAAHASPHPAVRASSVALLGELAHKKHAAALEGLFDLVICHQNESALSLIRKSSFHSSRPAIQAVFYLFSGQFPEYRSLDPHNAILTEFFFNRMNIEVQERLLIAAQRGNLKEWLLLVNALQATRPEPLLELVDSFGHFSIEHQKLTLFWLNQFARLQSSACEDAICQIFIQHDSTLALELARQEGYFPNAPIQAALFYFLAGDWDAYAQLDFNHALIAKAYETSSHPIRKRILEVSRLSGRQDWMTGLSTSARIVWLDDLNDPDWEITLSTLARAQRHDELWRLAQAAPPLWSARLLTELQSAGWRPPFTADEMRWNQLLSMAAHALDRKLKIQPAAVWRSPSPEITCLALNPQNQLLAAGGSDASIFLWETSAQHALAARLGSPTPQIRSLAFSPEGDYLVAASGDHALRTYRIKDAKLIKVMEGHTALVHRLTFHPDGRSLISSGFDGSIRVWRFPQGQLLNTIDLGRTEVFGLAISPDGQVLLHAGSDQFVTARRWPSGEMLYHLAGHEHTITNLASATFGPIAATASRDRQLMVWNYLAGRRLSHFDSGDEATTQLLFHPTHPVLVVGGIQGSLTIRSMTTGSILAQVRGHTAPITGLVAHQSGAQIFTSSLDGLICLWDLRAFLAIHQPQSHSPKDTASLSALRNANPSGSAEQAWIDFMIELTRWRQQYDIQIDESPALLSIGEFDIQL